MNERIKELWWKARIGYNEQNCDPEVLAKFAELIVKECVDICRYHPSRIVSNNWVGHDVAQDIVQQFEEHFGVEE
jgi:hypothetical protein